MKRHEDIAERIIKLEGLAFALAASVGKELDTARAMLKERIVRELGNEFNRGADLQRRSMEGRTDNGRPLAGTQLNGVVSPAHQGCE